MKKTFMILWVLSALCLSSWSCLPRTTLPTLPAPVPTPTPTQTSTPLCLSGNGINSQVFSTLPLILNVPTNNAVIRSLAQWNAYWALVPNPPALPAVNFANQMILLQTYTSCGSPTVNQACNSNGNWTVSETGINTFPNPCDPAFSQSLALVLGASASPVSILFTIPNSVIPPNPVVYIGTPVATPTPTPTIAPTPYVTVVP